MPKWKNNEGTHESVCKWTKGHESVCKWTKGVTYIFLYIFNKHFTIFSVIQSIDTLAHLDKKESGQENRIEAGRKVNRGGGEVGGGVGGELIM